MNFWILSDKQIKRSCIHARRYCTSPCSPNVLRAPPMSSLLSLLLEDIDYYWYSIQKPLHRIIVRKAKSARCACLYVSVCIRARKSMGMSPLGLIYADSSLNSGVFTWPLAIRATSGTTPPPFWAIELFRFVSCPSRHQMVNLLPLLPLPLYLFPFS